MTIAEFIPVYKQYLATNDATLKPKLLAWLAEFETIKTFAPPGFGTGNILAWEVLRNHTFYFPGALLPFQVFEGELIVQQHGWDRDVFINRVPIYEVVSGRVLAMREPEEKIFLPLYEADVIRNKALMYSQITTKEMFEFIDKEDAEAWQRYR